jgi:hypothetical protein
VKQFAIYWLPQWRCPGETEWEQEDDSLQVTKGMAELMVDHWKSLGGIWAGAEFRVVWRRVSLGPIASKRKS